MDLKLITLKNTDNIPVQTESSKGKAPNKFNGGFNAPGSSANGGAGISIPGMSANGLNQSSNGGLDVPGM